MATSRLIRYGNFIQSRRHRPFSVNNGWSSHVGLAVSLVAIPCRTKPWRPLSASVCHGLRKAFSKMWATQLLRLVRHLVLGRENLHAFRRRGVRVFFVVKNVCDGI